MDQAKRVLLRFGGYVVLAAMLPTRALFSSEKRGEKNSPMKNKVATLFLCGDVMTGRSIDQILPHPVDPQLFEEYVCDAREYVTLAERKNGAIEKPVDYS